MINRKRPENRAKGVLLPVFSLPSEYGIGCFSKEAMQFIDWLAETGHEYWQILPLNPTGNADSPYQPLSSFAGNAYFIDPVQLVEQDLILQEELDDFYFGEDPKRVEYEELYESRMQMLRIAHRRFAERIRNAQKNDMQTLADPVSDAAGAGAGAKDDAAAARAVDAAVAKAVDAAAYQRFREENSFWLEDYALFMALREEYGKELSWDDWPDPLRLRDPEEMAKAGEQYADWIDFYRWTQFEFYRQWGELKRHANARGVKIIGDMPVYVSYDSADCWASPGQFQLDEDLKMTMIAGVPPDGYADDGQLWGNPLYDWEKMKGNDYSWWVSRIRQSFELYDVIRLDHFRGYEAYYSCKADAVNGLHGIWRKGPGMELFRQLEKQHVLPGATEAAGHEAERGAAKAAGQAAESAAAAAQAAEDVPLCDRFIAEDLGSLTPEVMQLLEDTGFPGTKVLQFAFDGNPGNIYLPENYHRRCVVYTGTHDNDTTAGWFRGLTQNEQAGILQYLGYSGVDAWWLVLESDAAVKRGEMLNTAVTVCRECPAGKPIVRKVIDENGVPDPAVLATRLLIEKALDSSATIAIIPLQDYLCLGSEARTNTPGTIVNNWCVRIPDEEIWG